MFGYPDLGALIVRKESGNILRSRRYFGGGTVEMVIAVKDSWHASHYEALHEALEDGTLPFHNIVALEHAIYHHKRLYQSPVHISRYVSSLSAYAWQLLTNLKHHNGQKVFQMYKDLNGHFGDSKTQGPVMSFSILDDKGNVVGKSDFEKLAINCGMQLRTGGVCNPGGIATMLDLQPWEMRRNYYEGMRCGDDLDVLGGKPTGIIRISLGPMTIRDDIERFVLFVQKFFVNGDQFKLQPKLVASTSDLSSISSMIATITPIDGCDPFQIPLDDFDSVEAAKNAYTTWHHEWCLVDLRTNTPFQDSALKHLSVKMQPQEGVLSVEEKLEVVSKDSDLPPGPARFITVDLWRSPSRNGDNHEKAVLPLQKCDRTAYRYSDVEIQAFFTRVVGFPCTLARRTPREVSALEARNRTCAAWWCAREFACSEDLDHHYKEHATDFRRASSQHRLGYENLRRSWRSMARRLLPSCRG